MIDELSNRLPPGARVLDLGCGGGVPSTKRLASQFSVTGVDISTAQVAAARRNVPNAVFVHADLSEVDFPPGSFEAVTALYAISHVPRDEHAELFRRILRWLVPGGLFLATLGSADSPDWTGDWLGRRMFFSSHDADANRRLLIAAGFTMIMDEVIEMNEPEGPARFLWIIARRPSHFRVVGSSAASGKPLDVGNGRLVASFAATTPALVSVLAYHPEHGVAELSALPEFDESHRGDPDYVRRYRLLMTSDAFGCLELQTADGQRVMAERTDLSDPDRPVWHGRIGGASVTAEAFAAGDAIAIQWRVTGGEPHALRLHFTGRLDRPALAEITELDPPRPTGAVTTLSAERSRLVVQSTLPATLGLDADAGEWVIDGPKATLNAGPLLAVRIATLDDRPSGAQRARGMGDLEPTEPAARIVGRALAYVRGSTALRTTADEVVLLTDHRILPLSWTRDAYYQALLLLATGLPGDADLVADHLRWLWRRCDRPGGRWVRSHHANGRPKDIAFQADQQLYPIIELTDYWRARGSLPDGVDWKSEVGRAWAAAVAEVDAATGLMATTETAADDPAPAPFVSGSQVLLWYAALRLAEVAEAEGLGLDPGELRALGSAIRSGFDRHLVAGGRWLYATDAGQARVDYHDANDLPVALAPLLGFCDSADPGWRGTMDFAFSRANPGYFDGERAGLGSVHTPAPWTLGDVQAWIRARVGGDEASMAAALDRLAEVCFDDGMLPEAYSAGRNPDVRIRHWFAWPGAALGALLLLDARGELGSLKTR
jgi:SAM-dependent methyltransferase